MPPENVERWLLEALAFYRQLDFFSSPKTDEEVAEWLLRTAGRRYRRQDIGSPLVDDAWFFQRDLGLLFCDRRRTLSLDFESPGMGGHTMYEYELPRLARITRGVFQPAGIHELALDTERDGAVLLTFTANGEPREYILGSGNSDWLDWKLLWIVDEHLRDSEVRLHAAADPAPGQNIFLAALTAAERDAIEHRRRLEFVPLPAQPGSPWNWWWATV